MVDTPASAREKFGLELKQAAKRLRVGPVYLTRLERCGAWPFALAERAARLYQCRIEVFLVKRQSKQSKGGGETTRAQ